MRSAIVVGLSALLLAACGIEPQPEAEPQNKADTRADAPASPRFDGLIVAGSPADARASGFTDCVTEGNGYYGFTCANADAVILGVKPLRTIVNLQYPSDLPYDAERLPERTAYSSIVYQFPESEGYESQGCAYDAANPYACSPDQTQPLPTLTRSLREQGWLGRSVRWGAEYVKPNQPFKVSINTRRVGAEIGGERRDVVDVTVYPASDEEVAELIEMIQADQRQRSSRQTGNASFIDEMKAP